MNNDKFLRDSYKHFQSVRDARFQMGWDRHSLIPSFILGGDRYRALLSPEPIRIPENNTQDIYRAYHRSGSLERWKQVVEPYCYPSMFAHLFCLLVCGFGPPLLHFLGAESLLINQYGRMGSGKTILRKIIHSIYGRHSDLELIGDDSLTSIIKQCGAAGSLPVTIANNSNEDKWKEVSLSVKLGRVPRKASHKTDHRWQLVALVTSHYKLKTHEKYILHIPVEYQKEISPLAQVGMSYYLEENYGEAGAIYIQYLLDTYHKHPTNLKKITAVLSRTGLVTDNFSPDLLTAGTLALYAAIVVSELRLMNVPITEFHSWIAKKLPELIGTELH